MFSFWHVCSLWVSRIVRRNSLWELQIYSIYPWSYLRLSSNDRKTQETPAMKGEVHGFSLFFHLVLHAQGLTFMSEYHFYIPVYLLIIYRFKPVPDQERYLTSDHYLRFLQNKVPYKLQQKRKEKTCPQHWEIPLKYLEFFRVHCYAFGVCFILYFWGGFVGWLGFFHCVFGGIFLLFVLHSVAWCDCVVIIVVHS